MARGTWGGVVGHHSVFSSNLGHHDVKWPSKGING